MYKLTETLLWHGSNIEIKLEPINCEAHYFSSKCEIACSSLFIHEDVVESEAVIDFLDHYIAEGQIGIVEMIKNSL